MCNIPSSIQSTGMQNAKSRQETTATLPEEEDSRHTDNIIKIDATTNTNTNIPPFRHVAHSRKHSIGITNSGIAYSWGINNNFGQLGRPTKNAKDKNTPRPISLSADPAADADDSPLFVRRAYVGGRSDSGHSALLDSNGHLWMAGCDRWQQLGLGSPSGGSNGYTWADGGKIWRTEFCRNPHLTKFMQQHQQHIDTHSNVHIRDVALGADHTVVLASNQQDVYTFGKGSEGQLGLTGKPFVSAIVRSSVLSTSSSSLSNNSATRTSTSNSTHVSAVCAIDHCSLTLDSNGQVMNKAGKCNMTSPVATKALQACMDRAQREGLVQKPGLSAPTT